MDKKNLRTYLFGDIAGASIWKPYANRLFKTSPFSRTVCVGDTTIHVNPSSGRAFIWSDSKAGNSYRRILYVTSYYNFIDSIVVEDWKLMPLSPNTQRLTMTNRWYINIGRVIGSGRNLSFEDLFGYGNLILARFDASNPDIVYGVFKKVETSKIANGNKEVSYLTVHKFVIDDKQRRLIPVDIVHSDTYTSSLTTREGTGCGMQSVSKTFIKDIVDMYAKDGKIKLLVNQTDSTYWSKPFLLPTETGGIIFCPKPSDSYGLWNGQIIYNLEMGMIAHALCIEFNPYLFRLYTKREDVYFDDSRYFSVDTEERSSFYGVLLAADIPGGYDTFIITTKTPTSYNKYRAKCVLNENDFIYTSSPRHIDNPPTNVTLKDYIKGWTGGGWHYIEKIPSVTEIHSISNKFEFKGKDKWKDYKVKVGRTEVPIGYAGVEDIVSNHARYFSIIRPEPDYSFTYNLRYNIEFSYGMGIFEWEHFRYTSVNSDFNFGVDNEYPVFFLGWKPEKSSFLEGVMLNDWINPNDTQGGLSWGNLLFSDWGFEIVPYVRFNTKDKKFSVARDKNSLLYKWYEALEWLFGTPIPWYADFVIMPWEFYTPKESTVVDYINKLNDIAIFYEEDDHLYNNGFRVSKDFNTRRLKNGT